MLSPDYKCKGEHQINVILVPTTPEEALGACSLSYIHINQAMAAKL